jgi:hypothetical protein
VPQKNPGLRPAIRAIGAFPNVSPERIMIPYLAFPHCISVPGAGGSWVGNPARTEASSSTVEARGFFMPETSALLAVMASKILRVREVSASGR